MGPARTSMHRDYERAAGTLGLAVVVLIAAILAVHPITATEVYDDGALFVEHVNMFWLVIHLLAAVALMGVPVVIRAWGEVLHSPAGLLFGRLTGSLSIVGAALGVLHLAGTDSVAFYTYQDTLTTAGNRGASLVGADVLVRLHAATLTAWVLALFIGVPLAAAVAVACDGERRWRLWLPIAASVFATASVVVSLVERQWTTLADSALFRSGATLFVAWLGIASWELRRGARPGFDPAPTSPHGGTPMAQSEATVTE